MPPKAPEVLNSSRKRAEGSNSERWEFNTYNARYGTKIVCTPIGHVLFSCNLLTSPRYGYCYVSGIKPERDIIVRLHVSTGYALWEAMGRGRNSTLRTDDMKSAVDVDANRDMLSSLNRQNALVSHWRVMMVDRTALRLAFSLNSSSICLIERQFLNHWDLSSCIISFAECSYMQF